jgi:hypothetical protein
MQTCKKWRKRLKKSWLSLRLLESAEVKACAALCRVYKVIKTIIDKESKKPSFQILNMYLKRHGIRRHLKDSKDVF